MRQAQAKHSGSNQEHSRHEGSRHAAWYKEVSAMCEASLGRSPAVVGIDEVYTAQTAVQPTIAIITNSRPTLLKQLQNVLHGLVVRV